jgi:hypothetical protein
MKLEEKCIGISDAFTSLSNEPIPDYIASIVNV